MKYPLDREGIEDIIRDLSATDEANRLLIGQLLYFLELSIEYGAGDTADWYGDAAKLINEIKKRKMDFESLRFDQGNGHSLTKSSPYEKEEGKEWTEEELAKHFNESTPLPKRKEKTVSNMTLEEIEEWEKKQDNSNDIYKVAARVKNLAREGGGALTPVGEMLVNCYVHVLMALYGFTDTVENKDTKIKLHELIRSQESMPASFIQAVHAGVK